jgi:hypothetical protein
MSAKPWRSFAAALAVGFGLIGVGGSFAQSPLPPAARERLCAFDAHKLALTGDSYTAYMARCTRLGPPGVVRPPGLPPAQPPSAAPPPQPPAAAPLSPRAIECNKMIAEMGMSGAGAASFRARCLAGH